MRPQGWGQGWERERGRIEAELTSARDARERDLAGRPTPSASAMVRLTLALECESVEEVSTQTVSSASRCSKANCRWSPLQNFTTRWLHSM